MLEAVDGGKLVGGRVAFEGSVLLGGDGGEALAEALGVFGLGDGFAAIEVGAAGVGPGVGAEVEAAAGTQGKAGLGLDFGAVAAIGLAGVVGLLFEVAELEVALILGGTEFDAGFARGIVEDEMVVAALPVPAGGELLGLEAGEAGLVGVLLIALAGEEGGGVGAGLLGAAAEAVAGGIGLAAAVVGGADDEGAIDVAVLEGDEDFLAGARYEVAAPVAAGDGAHDAEPDAEALVSRGVVPQGDFLRGVRSGRVFAAAGGLAAALPRELDANAVVPVGVGGVGAANDDGGQRAAGGWPGVDAAAVGIGTQRLPGDVGTEGGDPVAIEVDTVFFSAFLIGVAVRVGGRGKQVQGITRFVGDGGDEKLAVFLGVTIMLGVVGQHEGGAGGGTADGALAVVLLQACVDGLALVAEHALAVGAVRPGVLARVVPGGGVR